MGAGVGEVIVTADGQIINAGRIHAAGDVALQSGADIDNRGAIYARGSASVRAQGKIGNPGSLAAAEHTQAIARYIESGGLMAAGLDTQGHLSGTGDLNIQAERVRSSGTQLAAGTLGISGDELDLAGASHFAGGEFYAGARDRLVFDGGSVSAARLAIQAGSLSNAGGVLTQWGEEQGQIISAGGINNQDGQIQGTGQLLVRSRAVLNNRRGHISGQGGPNALIVLANDLDNTDGRIHTTAGSGGDLAIELGGILTNTRGHISAERDAAVHVGGDYTHRQSASLIAGRNLALSATGTLTNEAELIAAGQLAVSGAKLTNHGQLAAGGLLVAQAQNQLTNTGTMLGASVLAQAGDTLLNEGPDAAILGSDQNGRIELLAQHIINRDPVTHTNTPASTAIHGLGQIILAGGVDAEGHYTSAQSIQNISASLISGGDMSLVADTLTNARRVFKTSDTYDEYLRTETGTVVWTTDKPDVIGGRYIEPPRGGKMNSDYLYTQYTGVVYRNRVLEESPGALIEVGGDLHTPAPIKVANQLSRIAVAGNSSLSESELDQDWSGTPLGEATYYSGQYIYKTYKGKIWSNTWSSNEAHIKPIQSKYDASLTCPERDFI